MRELLATNDPVILSYATSLLDSDGIASIVLDQNISSIEGSIGAFPRRVAVGDADWCDATRLLEDAGLGQWIKRDA
ncbi:MAG: putative signal transducing protein [Hyphomicrobium sp.]